MSRNTSRRTGNDQSRLAAYRPFLDRAIFVLALVGILVTVHLRIQEGRGFDQGCWGFNPEDAASAAVFDCAAVTGSEVGKLFGIPNSILGLLFYLTVAALSAGILYTREGQRVLLRRVRTGLLGVGFLFSMYLVYVQRVQIGEYCALCLTSAAIATTLFVLAAVAWFTRPPARPKKAPALASKDVRLYAILAGLTLLLVGADVAYFASLERNLPAPNVAVAPAEPAPAPAALTAPQQCSVDTRYGTVSNYMDLVDFTDPMAGNPNAEVTVIEFFDPNCGHCASLHPTMKRMVDAYGDRVAFYFKPFELNPQVAARMAQTQALHAANAQGKFMEMMTAQLQNQHLSGGRGLPPDVLQQIATGIGMDADLMAEQLRDGDFRGKVARDRHLGSTIANLRGVPMVLVNGLPIGNKSDYCMQQYIDEALAETAPADAATASDGAAAEPTATADS